MTPAATSSGVVLLREAEPSSRANASSGVHLVLAMAIPRAVARRLVKPSGSVSTRAYLSASNTDDEVAQRLAGGPPAGSGLAPSAQVEQTARPRGDVSRSVHRAAVDESRDVA